MSNTTTDSALIAEIPTAIASAEEAIKAAKTIGERTKAMASKQAWEKVAQMADRVISEFIIEGTTSTSETATRGAYRTLYGAETSVVAGDVKATVDALIARPEVSLVEVSPVTRRGVFGHAIKGEPVAILARMLDGRFSIVWGQLEGGYRRLVEGAR